MSGNYTYFIIRHPDGTIVRVVLSAESDPIRPRFITAA